MVSIVFYFYYFENFVTLTLVHLLLVLVLGQFFHYWYNKLRKVDAEFSYTKQRLEELSNAFYTLKISHDTLEKSYAVQPHSLRLSIKELESLFYKDSSHYENFLRLIGQTFYAQESLIALKQNGTFETVASIEEKKTLKLNDPLVKKTLDSKETSYISKDTKNESLYLAVIPTKDKDDNIVALLAIDYMPFSDFNENNIISIAILFSYFINKVQLWKKFKKDGVKNIDKNTYFLHSYEIMSSLQKEYNTSSSVIIFKTKSLLTKHALTERLDITLRGLDIYQDKSTNKQYIIKLFLPFTAKSATNSILNKILSSHNLSDNNNIEYLTFGIEQDSLINQYIKGEV
jgi:hypothetical protein